jgi:hypothetical protein
MATPGAMDVTVYCGRDFYLSVTNSTAQGNPFSMVGYSAVLTIKARINDSDAAALYQGAPWSSNLAFGELTFKVPHLTTAAWWKTPPAGSGAISTTCVYDVSYADAASPKNWSTMLTGAVSLAQPVTVVIPGG